VKRVRALFGAAACMLAAHASASGLNQLKAFLDGARTGRTTFKQVVAARSGRMPQESQGTFAFARPGKFRWSYEKPYAQLIVGDGEKLWIYDKDLNQVIVKKLDNALGATPAALLTGDNALETNFELSDGGTTDGVEYVNAKPKTADTGFDSVKIGLKDNVPRVMELHDTFGQTTSLTFGAFERNPKLDSGTFQFVPPAGADVVGG
jgi:outer membrane lipoprotein carrier protein